MRQPLLNCRSAAFACSAQEIREGFIGKIILLYADCVRERCGGLEAYSLSNAAAFICIHNHPSGNGEPSQADIAVTERLVKCGELMGIKMLDHIIIAGETGEQTSFLREGLLDGMRSTDDYTSEWER